METEKDDSTEECGFVAALESLRGGDAVKELDEELADVLHAVEVTGKPGKLVLTLIVAPGGARKVLLVDQVKPTKPQAEKAKTVFFTKSGRLFEVDPDQGQLPFVVEPFHREHAAE